jgi:hypothetical protein
MGNTLTALIPTLFKSVRQVNREAVGFIPAVSKDFSPEEMKMSTGQTMKLPVSVSQSLSNYTAAMSSSAGTDKTPTTVDLTIANNKESSFNLTHEEEQMLINGGTLPGFREDQIAECFRAFTNQMESDIRDALIAKASRAYGTAGTTPFASGLSDSAKLRRIFADNGAWVNGQMSLVVSSATGENLRSLTQLTNVNQSGSDDVLRRGVLFDLNGFQVRESAGCTLHTAGTGSSATTDDTGYTVDSTTLTLDSAGTGTILSGDVVSFAGDSNNKYCVNTGDSDVSDGGTIVLGNPGLKVAMSAATKAITVTGDYTPNFAFRKSSVLLYARPPIIKRTPILDTTMVTDPESGLSFLVCEIMGDGMTTYRLNLAWGISVLKSSMAAILIG